MDRNGFWSAVSKQSYLIFSVLKTQKITSSACSHYCLPWYYLKPIRKKRRKNWIVKEMIKEKSWVSNITFFITPPPSHVLFCYVFHGHILLTLPQTFKPAGKLNKSYIQFLPRPKVPRKITFLPNCF